MKGLIQVLGFCVVCLLFFCVACKPFDNDTCDLNDTNPLSFDKMNPKRYVGMMEVDGFYWADKFIFTGFLLTKDKAIKCINLPYSGGMKITVYYDATDKPWYEYDYQFCRWCGWYGHKGWVNIHIRKDWVVTFDNGRKLVIPYEGTVRRRLSKAGLYDMIHEQKPLEVGDRI